MSWGIRDAASGQCVTWSRWDRLPFDTSTQELIECDAPWPDPPGVVQQRAASARNAALEAAAVIVETIDETADPVLLAVRELVFVLMEEIQSIKGGKPKPSKQWDAHKAATAASLLAKKT
jgi:hypothetical protein